MDLDIKTGVTYLGNNRSRFVVWAPFARNVTVHLLNRRERVSTLEKTSSGYHFGIIDDAVPKTLYRFELDHGNLRPDPASRYQPEGVHGPSEITAPDFDWDDANWTGVPLNRYIVYEVHVGTFTAEGTLEAVISRLKTLKELGITALELMPVAQFPGKHNWGYDTAYPFAVQNSYGGPSGLKKLVNACHHAGISVILDVVYNHLGPEGNYLNDFGPYFTDKYTTPWGAAINFDGPENDHVRRFFIENAIYWIQDFHIDALRIDAVHAIPDFSARPFLQELSETVHRLSARLNRRIYLIAESDLNDTKIIRPVSEGGYNLDAHWNEDFHHSLHSLLTGETQGYYQDFGTLNHLAAAYRDGYVYSGQYSIYRRRRHGNTARGIPAHRFVVFSQNHDQVGNRMLGERLSTLVSFSALKLTASVVLLSPFIPLLFMGEEYAETAPFQYFIHHSDPGLIEAVRKGRHDEFKAFQWKGSPPDPQDISTFANCRLNPELRGTGHHQALFELHRYLIHLRRTLAPLDIPAVDTETPPPLKVSTNVSDNLLIIERRYGSHHVLMLYHFSGTSRSVDFRFPPGQWIKLLDTADAQWLGPGSRVPDRIVGKEPALQLLLTPYQALVFTCKKQLVEELEVL